MAKLAFWKRKKQDLERQMTNIVEADRIYQELHEAGLKQSELEAKIDPDIVADANTDPAPVTGSSQSSPISAAATAIQSSSTAVADANCILQIHQASLNGQSQLISELEATIRQQPLAENAVRTLGGELKKYAIENAQLKKLF